MGDINEDDNTITWLELSNVLEDSDLSGLEVPILESEVDHANEPPVAPAPGFSRQEELPYICDIPSCEKRFKSSEARGDHLKSHLDDGSRAYRCPKCPVVLFSQASFRSHKMRHKREYETFDCEPCGKSYATKEGLRLHVQDKHLDQKDWVCPAECCNMAFVRKQQLRSHVRSMHTKKVFVCAFAGCEKEFPTNSKLRTHIKDSHMPHNGVLEKATGKKGQHRFHEPETDALMKLAKAARLESRKKRKLMKKAEKGRKKKVKQADPIVTVVDESLEYEVI